MRLLFSCQLVLRARSSNSKRASFLWHPKCYKTWVKSKTFQRNTRMTTLNYTRLYIQGNLMNNMDKTKEIGSDEAAQVSSVTASQEIKCVEQSNQVQTLSKRAMKRLARVEKHKEYKRLKRAEKQHLKQRDDAGYCINDLLQSSYYFENGLRKVYPYSYVFATHAKRRWIGRNIKEVLEQEFGYDQPDDLMKSFDRGMIEVNGERAAVDYVIQDNDYISHQTHRHENPVTAAPIEILENSEELVVVNKPSSIPCHPCGRYRFNSLPFILGKDMGLINLRNIYRLDRLTSGILIMAKSPTRTKELMEQVAGRQVHKEYVCRVVGQFPDGTVTVDQPLMALSNKLRLQVVSPTGKPSQTTFTRISYNGRSSVVRCIPHTGRTHQIRVHLQYLGHPILNDAFYNSEAWGPSRGKNGVYEVDHDKVCERILAEHQKSLWVGRDNPIYEEKLRKMISQESNVRNCLDAVTSVLSDEPARNQAANNSLPDAHNVSADLGTSSSDGASANGEISLNGHATGITSQGVSADLGTDTVSGASPKRHAEMSLSSLPLQAVDLPGFELSKWSVDLSCDQCKNWPIDPKTKQLVMFLHAIKYKGPGWAYETAMPDWALESWNREEDFMLGDDGCGDP